MPETDLLAIIDKVSKLKKGKERKENQHVALLVQEKSDACGSLWLIRVAILCGCPCGGRLVCWLAAVTVTTDATGFADTTEFSHG